MALQYQYGNALASISSIASPKAEIPGSQVIIGVLVVNKGEPGTIYVDLEDPVAFILTDYQFLQLGFGESKFFLLSATMPSEPRTYIIRAGHVIVDNLGVTQTLIDTSAQVVVGVAGVIEGKIPPVGATDAFVINGSFGIWIIEFIQANLINFIASVIAEFQGVNLLRIDTVPDKGKIIMWVSSTIPLEKDLYGRSVQYQWGTTSKQIITRILTKNRAFWWDIGFAIIGITVISLASIYRDITVSNNQVREDVVEAQQTCLTIPGLTEEQRLQCQINLANALPKPIPYGTIVGGIVVSAGALAVASVLSRPK